MLSAQHETFEPPVSFLGKLLHVKAVHHAVDGHQHMGLLVVGVDPLTDCDQPDAGEVQPLKECQRILRISRQSAAVVKEDNVEGARRRERRSQQAPQPRAVRADAAQRFIGINVLFQKVNP